MARLLPIGTCVTTPTPTARHAWRRDAKWHKMRGLVIGHNGESNVLFLFGGRHNQIGNYPTSLLRVALRCRNTEITHALHELRALRDERDWDRQEAKRTNKRLHESYAGRVEEWLVNLDEALANYTPRRGKHR